MILTNLLWSPIFFILLLLFFKKDHYLKVLGFSLSVMHFFYGVFICTRFEIENKNYQMIELASIFKPLGMHYSLGVDGLSLLLIMFSLFMMPLIILGTWNFMGIRVKSYFINLFALQICMIGILLSLDLILFYMFFELSLIPIFLLMGMYGGKKNFSAAKIFFLFIFVSSIFLMGSIVTMMVLFESVNGVISSLIIDLQTIQLPFVKNTVFSTQTVLFSGFFIAFAVRAALFPLHTWLPNTHVKTSTGGSIVLEILMLNIGAYGMIRFLSLYFPQASSQYAWVVCILAIIGIIYSAMITFSQTDMKRFVAYLSVFHMGYIVLGIFCWDTVSYKGVLFQMLSRGLSTGGLFLMIGMLYERFKTRQIKDFGGLVKTMPNFTIYFLLISLTSMAVPLTNGFIGNFLILFGVFATNKYYGIFAVFGICLIAGSMSNMIRKVFFGALSDKFSHLSDVDLSKREMFVLTPIVILIFLMGIYPKSITSFLTKSNQEIESLQVRGDDYVIQ